MKKFLFTFVFLLFLLINILAQAKPVKIMFDVTSNDTLTHQTTLRHVSSKASAYPESEFEVVVCGSALSMLMKVKSTVAKGIKGLDNNKNVSFKICEATMKRSHVDQNQLLPNIILVPDTITEIVTKQKEGWGYIKESHN